MAHVAARTGLPIMRAMPLAFPDDEAGPDLIQQYMFGEWFLTGAFVDDIHLPAGRWIDYWTGAVHEGPVDLPCQVPDGRAGPLFVKAGALIPEWPKVDYVGQQVIETLGLDVYPWETSTFTLYEDDGETYAHLDGNLAATAMECCAGDSEVRLEIGARQGQYEGMPERRSYEVRLHLEGKPAVVTVDGARLDDGAAGWTWDEEAGVATVPVAEDPQRTRPVALVCGL